MFKTWLTGLLWWFRVYNVTGNHKYSLQVDLCGTTLTGLAATWYADKVEAWNRATRVWLFEELICHLYKRFMHNVTVQNAATSYQKTKFYKAKGALCQRLAEYRNPLGQSKDKTYSHTCGTAR